MRNLAKHLVLISTPLALLLGLLTLANALTIQGKEGTCIQGNCISTKIQGDAVAEENIGGSVLRNDGFNILRNAGGNILRT